MSFDGRENPLGFQFYNYNLLKMWDNDEFPFLSFSEVSKVCESGCVVGGSVN